MRPSGTAESGSVLLVRGDGCMVRYATNSSLENEGLGQRGGDQVCRERESAALSVTRAAGPEIPAAVLQRAVEASLSGTCIADREGRIVFANASLLAMWGYDLQEVIGQPVDLLWLSGGEGVDPIGCALSTGRWDGTLCARRRDSSPFDARVSVSTVSGPDATDLSLLVSCIDVTVQRGAENAPGHHRSLVRAVAAMPARFVDPAVIDPAIETSLEDLGRACGASRTTLSLFNEARTLLGTTHEWCRPERGSRRGEFQPLFAHDLPWWVARILEGETVLVGGASGGGRLRGEEREFLKRHGIGATVMIPLRLNGAIVGFVEFDRDTGGSGFADGEVILLSAAVYVIASALDRKQSEYVFRKSEDLYQVVLDAITDTVTVVDTALTLLLANDAFVAWCEELGLPTDVVGKNLFAALPFLPPTARQQYERVIRTGRPLTSERSLRLGDGIVVLREMLIPIFEHGEVGRIITVSRDITAQREVEDLKSKAYNQVERNMEQFALLADHIRNPLQAIMGRAELIDDPATTEKIRQQVQRINGIIDQLDERWAESRKLSMFWRKYS